MRVQGEDIEQNVVNAHPTTASLGQFLSSSATDKINTNAMTPSSHAEEMEKMVEEFTRDFPRHTPTREAPKEEVILVTGTTGTLGTYILEKLIATPSVQRIYALNRPAKDKHTTLQKRQIDAFRTHGVHESLLDSPKLVLLEGNTTLTDLGLPRQQFQEIASSVTSIIHNGV